MLKVKLFSELNLELVSLRRPVVSSSVAPVKDWYLLKALVAIKRSVVPVSTMPAVDDKIVVDPYSMLWFIPQYSLAGDVEATIPILKQKLLMTEKCLT